MKKLFIVLAVASLGFVACNNEAETPAVNEDSLKAAATADSLAKAAAATVDSTAAAATSTVDSAAKAATTAVDSAAKAH